jgi:hypothetical protein
MKVYVYLPLWNWPHLARKRMHGQLCRSWGVMLKTVFDPDGQNKCSSVSESWELLHLDLSNTWGWVKTLVPSVHIKIAGKYMDVHPPNKWYFYRYWSIATSWNLGQNPNIPTSTSMDSMVVNLHLVGYRPLLYLCPDRACSLFVHIMYIYTHTYTYTYRIYIYIYIIMYTMYI